MSPKHQDYKVAIMFAMDFEMTALRYMLDDHHADLPSSVGDSNDYILGKLSGHNVVLSCLPGTKGKAAAATMSNDLERTFPSIVWRFFVGIGGGVADPENNDIRLGDVVVSMPQGAHGGIVQYDLGRETESSGFTPKGFLMPPPARVRNAIQRMKSDHAVKDNRIAEFHEFMLKKYPRLRRKYNKPRPETDRLFQDDYPHQIEGEDCQNCCDPGRLVTSRPSRESEDDDDGSVPDNNIPEIHYGLIASGDSVMMNRGRREQIIRQVSGGSSGSSVLCFEMEAAGVSTNLECTLIRGISDYVDSHKNKEWQHYAAAAAAGCTKELLTYLKTEEEGVSRGSGDDEEEYDGFYTTSGESPGRGRGQRAIEYRNVFQGRGIQQNGGGSITMRDLNFA